MDNICARIADRIPTYLDHEADLIALARASTARDLATFQSTGHTRKDTASSYGFLRAMRIMGRGDKR